LRWAAREICIVSPLKRALGVFAALSLIGGPPLVLAGSLDVIARTVDNHPVEGAIVTVFALDGANKPAAPIAAVVDQIKLAFAPDLTVIPVGSTISFPNSDTTRHQVYSFSPAHRFQLPMYRGKPYPPVRFDEPGLITLGCNIHDGMLAYVVVTDAQYFGRTDSHGEFNVPNVAHGRYRVTIWHPRLKDSAESVVKDVIVGDGERAAATIKLDKALRLSPLKGRPHSWDAY
jgi:plastocyanin